jgi:hypothetical protein
MLSESIRGDRRSPGEHKGYRRSRRDKIDALREHKGRYRCSPESIRVSALLEKGRGVSIPSWRQRSMLSRRIRGIDPPGE